MKRRSKCTLLIICIIGIIVFTLILTGSDVYALSGDQHEKESYDKIFDEQIEMINADSLFDSLPEETKNGLREIGIDSVNYDRLTDIRIEDLIGQVISSAGVLSSTPLSGAAVCIGIMLLCTMTEGFGITISLNKVRTVSDTVAALCICTALIVPICSTAARVNELLSGASAFMMLYVPMLAGLAVTSGNESVGASYYSMMMSAGNVISIASSKLIMPLLNIFLSLSVTGALSPKMNLSSICDGVYKCAKQIITILTIVFVTLLSLQTIVTSSIDHVSGRVLRFAVSSFVPVVGGVLGEALNTFSGSIQLLKSGLGVFVIIASSVLVIPVTVECIIWRFSIYVLSMASELMGFGQATKLLSAVSKAIGMMLALIACVVVIFFISTVIVILAGK